MTGMKGAAFAGAGAISMYFGVCKRTDICIFGGMLVCRHPCLPVPVCVHD